MNAAARPFVRILLDRQELLLFSADGVCLRRYVVSTGANGVGEENGSGKTPRGLHRIRAKIGANAPENTVFRARRPSGEIWSPEYAATQPAGRDWILTRILWLCGCEPGKNRLGTVDTQRRYIYLHGTPDTVALGAPGSKGCVRMRNADIIELFDLLPVGAPVEILEHTPAPAVHLLPWTHARALSLPLRLRVFTDEQNVPVELEEDEADVTALHAVALNAQGIAIATARLLPDGHIGRLAVAREARRQGLGGLLMQTLMEQAQQRGAREILLHAQTHAQAFYQRLGFTPEGDVFPEAGIPHRLMRRAL